MTPAGKIADLQLLRGLAIGLVLVEHVPLPRAVADRLAVPGHSPGWLGVDLFFVVSGYVITRSLARDRFEPVAFVVRRLFRLTPPLALLVGLTAGLAVAADRGLVPGMPAAVWVPGVGDVGRRCAAALAGLYTVQPPGGALLGVVWSLSVEDQFYAAVAVVCLAGAAAGGRASGWLLAGLAAGVYLLVLAARLGFLARGHLAASPAVVYLLFFRFDLLAVGVLAGLADLRYGRRIAGWVARPGPYLAPALLAAPLALAAVCGGPSPPARLPHGLVLAAAGWCFAPLVLIAAHEAAWPPARRGRGYRLLTALGDRSYGVYLFHGPAMLSGFAALGWPDGRLPVRPAVIHAAVMAVVLAATVELLYRGIEKPLTARGRRLANRLKVRPPAGQVPRNHRMSDQPGSKLSPLAAAAGSS